METAAAAAAPARQDGDALAEACVLPTAGVCDVGAADAGLAGEVDRADEAGEEAECAVDAVPHPAASSASPQSVAAGQALVTAHASVVTTRTTLHQRVWLQMPLGSTTFVAQLAGHDHGNYARV